MSTTHPIRVGPFVLEAPIGRGGVGEVWRAHHHQTGAPAAIKVITTSRAQDTQLRLGLREELRAVAGLDHPHIVQVYDHGDLDALAAAHSQGRLIEGSPWIAMELASAGSLVAAARPTDWPGLRELLSCLLRALAHAHARGIVHLDLKPDNVLLGGGSARPGPKLTDFGVAHMLGRQARGDWREVRSLRVTASSLDRSGRLAGTPWYMAPEQFSGAWRDFGPWTDLYALGCLSFVLVTGRPPFPLDHLADLARAHWHRPPPPLRPTFPLPAGFEAWLMQLLAKPPSERFQHCADADAALRALGEAPNNEPGLAPAFSGTPTLVRGTLTLAQTRLSGEPTTLVSNHSATVVAPSAPGQPAWRTGELPGGRHEEPRGRGPISTPPPPLFPGSWRPEYPPSPPPSLWAASLGLYHLRSLPLVGREAERDLIWEMLGHVHREGRAQALIVEGVTGVGKSRLVEWTGERAEELGAARVLKALHSPEGGETDGLIATVARHLMCIELPPTPARERVARALAEQGAEDAWEIQALTDLLTPMLRTGGGEEGERLVGASPAPPAEQQHAVLYHFLSGVAQRRPLIVWIDDAQWGPAAVGFAQWALSVQQTQPGRMLLVLTARTDGGDSSPHAREGLKRLAERPDVRRIELAPLDEREQATLVGQLLGLEASLARQVQERSAGNPLFAVQLVGDWVQRGLLTGGPNGMVLRPGEDTSLPTDLRQLWSERIAHLLTGQPASHHHALELAATLGQRFDVAEWRAAGEILGLPAPEGVLEQLREVGLLSRPWGASPSSPGGEAWTFSHGMLRESLLHAAVEEGRAPGYHRACAALLAESAGAADRRERLGRHLLGAGDYAAALTPLAQSCHAHSSRQQHVEASRIWALWEEAERRAGLPPDDERILDGMTIAAGLFTQMGQAEKALAAGEALLRATSSDGGDTRRAKVLTALGVLSMSQQRYPEAQALHEQAAQMWRGAGDLRVLAVALGNCGEVLLARMQWDKARECCEEALQLNRQVGAMDGELHNLVLLATLEILAGRDSAAEALYLRTQALARSHGTMKRVADAERGLGNVALRAGDLERARLHFTGALELYQRTGRRPMEAKSWNDLAEVLRRQGDMGGAEAGYRHALSLNPNLVALLNLGTLLAQRGAYKEARTHLLSCLERIEAGGNLQLLGAVYSALLTCHCGLDEEQGGAEALARARSLLDQPAQIEPEDVEMVARAGALARAHGRIPFAEQIDALAAEMAERIPLPQRGLTRVAAAGGRLATPTDRPRAPRASRRVSGGAPRGLTPQASPPDRGLVARTTPPARGDEA